MKRLSAITFAVLILLNAVGYYGVFIGLHFHHEQKFGNSLDGDSYDAARTVTIKVPLSIPYASNQHTFERINGKFEHHGKVYRLVKQRYSSDTLTIICIRDTEHEQIDQALANFVKTFADQSHHQKSSSKLTGSFLKDYLPHSCTISNNSEGWSATVIHNTAQRVLCPAYLASINQPPKLSLPA